MRKITRLVCCVALCAIGCALACLVPTAVAGDQQQDAPPRGLPPSPLEAFVIRPTAKLVWSKVIGRLETPKARAIITALVVEDTTSTPNFMRGVRIDLAHVGGTPSCDWKYWAWRIMCQRANAAVYVEERRLEAVRNGLERGGAELRPLEFISQYWTNASGQKSTGLIVCGYEFPDRQPSELASLLASAATELKAEPR